MEELNYFFEKNYDNAIKLKIAFKKTEKKEWDKLTVLNELAVQIGHVFQILYGNEYVNEQGRNINNLGDEISDVFLQTMYLSYLENYDLRTTSFKCNEKTTITQLPIIFGQLTEAIMEEENYRFNKPRYNFETINNFIKDRINKIIYIMFNFSKENKIDISKEFQLMFEDASQFLNNYEI